MRAPDDPAASIRIPPGASPRTWLLLGDKRGDNGQVEIVEKALGWVCERKSISVREPYIVGKPKVAASLHHIDLSRSDPLEPPWPDLIITIGRRPSMAALWIREQSKGHTKIVLLGKPSGRLESFDLVIPSAEARLPPLPNVLPITLPLMRMNEAAITAAVVAWKPRLAGLPRPLIAFLVGGPTKPFAFDATVAHRLLDAVGKMAADTGGTPYITTSRRTPPAVVDALRARLPTGAHLFQWTPGATENPYLGLLGLADGFVVTGDSISMMVEVARLRKPLAIFELPLDRLGLLGQPHRSLARFLFAPVAGSLKDRLRRQLTKAAYYSGFIRQTRDFKAFHELLIGRGLAVRFGDDLRPPEGEVPDDLPMVVARIKALMNSC